MSRAYSKFEWGLIRGARLPAHTKRWSIRWMGVKIVEVFFPQRKADVGEENFPIRQGRRSRRGARGARKGHSRSRSTVIREKRETSKLAARPQLPARHSEVARSTRVVLSRPRFVNWVDRRVNVIMADIIAGLDVDDLVEWESQDYHPSMVPWVAKGVRRVTNAPPWSYQVRSILDWRLVRAWNRRERLLRELTAKKKRSPPPLYVERAMAVKLRTWYSGSGGRLPRSGFESFTWMPTPPTQVSTRRDLRRSTPREAGECRHRAHRCFVVCPSGHGVGAGICRCPFCGWRR